MPGFERALVDAGYRKYGDDGANLVKRYWVNHIDNEYTQFMQYLYQSSVTRGASQFAVRAGLKKADGNLVTQVEADQAKVTIPEDYLSEAFMKRQTRSLLLSFVVGATLGTTVLIGGAHYLKQVYKH